MTGGRAIMAAAGLLGLSGVVLAALGSHAVEGLDDFANYRSWQSANHMHLLHALALMFIANRYVQYGDRLLAAAAGVFFVGVLLFSGSIYVSILTTLDGVTAVAPAGGMLLMLGWLLIVVHAFRGRQP